MPMPVYETERLLLRPFTEQDVHAFHRMTSDPEVLKYIGSGLDPDLPPDEVIELMHIAPLGDYEQHGYGRHAMVYKDTNEVIGFTGLKYLPEINQSDIGYRMFPEFWGQGLATESCWPMLEFAFQELQLTEIIGLAMPENKASCHVLVKIGMQFVDERELFDEWVSYFVMSREDYLSNTPDS